MLVSHACFFLSSYLVKEVRRWEGVKHDTLIYILAFSTILVTFIVKTSENIAYEHVKER
jgi:hypothetical protein